MAKPKAWAVLEDGNTIRSFHDGDDINDVFVVVEANAVVSRALNRRSFEALTRIAFLSKYGSEIHEIAAEALTPSAESDGPDA